MAQQRSKLEQLQSNLDKSRKNFVKILETGEVKDSIEMKLIFNDFLNLVLRVDKIKE